MQKAKLPNLPVLVVQYWLRTIFMGRCSMAFCIFHPKRAFTEYGGCNDSTSDYTRRWCQYNKRVFCRIL